MIPTKPRRFQNFSDSQQKMKSGRNKNGRTSISSHEPNSLLRDLCIDCEDIFSILSMERAIPQITTSLFHASQSSLKNGSHSDRNTNLITDETESDVIIYNWSGKNSFAQYLDVSDGCFAMGGGGKDSNFGIIIENNFNQGSSGRCDTFDNPPLSSEGVFDIIDFEMYCFLSAPLRCETESLKN
mmetsp:Transcript_40222/g.94564  ORF Transcript_40222/g.94564 Transcript_40222/m.94564 type:complete len:184 (+) Transcript_40222:1231-1782(+)